MGRRRILLSDITMWVGILFLVFLVLNCAWFKPMTYYGSLPYYQHFSLSDFMPMLLGVVFLLGAYVFMEVKTNGMRPHFFLFGIGTIIFVVNTIAVLIMPETVRYTFSYTGSGPYTVAYTMTGQNRVIFILVGLLVSFIPFLFAYVAPRRNFYKKYFWFISGAFGLIVVYTMLFSYITEWDSYVAVIRMRFSPATPDEYNLCPESYFYQRTQFGQFFLLVILMAIILNSIRPHWCFYALQGVALTNCLFTLSKTNIVLGALAILSALLVRFFMTYKAHRKRNLISMSVIGGIVFILVMLIPLSFVIDTGFFASIKSVVTNVFGSNAARTFGMREELWKNMFVLFQNPADWLFGKGYSLFNDLDLLINSAGLADGFGEGLSNPHNGLLNILGENGIIGVLCQAALLAYVIKASIRVFKVDRSTSINCWIVSACVIVTSLFEGITLFDANITSLCFTILAVVPVFGVYYSEKEKANADSLLIEAETMQKAKKEEKARGSFHYGAIASFVISPLLMVAISLNPFFGLASGFQSFASVPFNISLIAFSIAFPIVFDRFFLEGDRSIRVTLALALFTMVLFPLIAFLINNDAVSYVSIGIDALMVVMAVFRFYRKEDIKPMLIAIGLSLVPAIVFSFVSHLAFQLGIKDTQFAFSMAFLMVSAFGVSFFFLKPIHPYFEGAVSLFRTINEKDIVMVSKGIKRERGLL